MYLTFNIEIECELFLIHSMSCFLINLIINSLNNGLKLSKKCGHYGFTGIDLTIYIESDTTRTCDVRVRAYAETRTKLQACAKA